MGHTIAKRTVAAAVAGAALLLTSAGACGPAENGDVPGVTDQQGGDEGDDNDEGDDQGDGDQGDGDQGDGDQGDGDQGGEEGDEGDENDG